jgi:endonuclease/exonuclease/phosphatase family metal-dependent hydrolase
MGSSRGYGAAQDEQNSEFLAELVRICEDEMLPLLVGGDFNITRRKEEKNNEILMSDGLLFSMLLLRV